MFIEKSFPYEMNDEIRTLHQKMKSMGDVKAFHILVLLLRLRQICCHPGLIEGVSGYIYIFMHLLAIKLRSSVWSQSYGLVHRRDLSRYAWTCPQEVPEECRVS
jgi:SNF2 family DNA or RNA helicase